MVVSAEEETSSQLCSLDNHIVALADVNVQDVGGVRFDRNEICCDDGELMVVEINLVCGLDSTVDESEQVFLAWRKSLGCNEPGARNISRLVIAVPDILSVD